MAPEMLKKNPSYNFPVDWWAIGTLTYDFIVGVSVFQTNSKDYRKLFRLIETREVHFPDERYGINVSEECKDFIRKILVKDPNGRLGSEGGYEEILSHPWFASIDMKKLLAK